MGIREGGGAKGVRKTSAAPRRRNTDAFPIFFFSFSCHPLKHMKPRNHIDDAFQSHPYTTRSIHAIRSFSFHSPIYLRLHTNVFIPTPHHVCCLSYSLFTYLVRRACRLISLQFCFFVFVFVLVPRSLSSFLLYLTHSIYLIVSIVLLHLPFVFLASIPTIPTYILPYEAF